MEGEARGESTMRNDADEKALKNWLDQPVRLNVGGTHFTATKRTLLGESDTYFSSLIGNDSWAPDEDGEFFIDRNPRFFQAILDYLRMAASGGQPELIVGRIPPEEWILLIDDIEYYMLGRLKHNLMGSSSTSWKLDSRSMGSNLVLSEDCLCVVKTGLSGNSDSGVIGSCGFLEGTYRWRVILDPKETFWIFFGVSPACYQDHPIHRSPPDRALLL